MNRDLLKIKKQVYEIISNVFEIPIDSISDNMMSINIKNWDSLGQFSMIAAIEHQFNVNFEVVDIFRVVTVQSLIDIVNEKYYDTMD